MEGFTAQPWFKAGNFATGGHRKGKYTPLRALTSRLGASKLLQLQPSLIRDMVLSGFPTLSKCMCPCMTACSQQPSRNSVTCNTAARHAACQGEDTEGSARLLAACVQVQAMHLDPICPAIAGLLEAVLGSLRHERLASSGVLA